MKWKKSGGLFLTLAAALVLLFGSGLCPDTARAEVVIIANASVQVNGITKEKLKNIFTGQQVRWSNGQPIKPVLLAEGDVHTNFVQKFVDKTPNQFENFWRKMIFTGQGIKPRTFRSEQELVEYVAETEGAIGYVSASNRAAKTKTLDVSGN